MKLIIAGGRDYKPNKGDILFLRTIKEEVTEVVSGCASGADKFGEEWANYNNIPIKHFPANWERYGKSAGPKRNKQMAEYGDAVCLFKGGRGTNNMYLNAVENNLIIFDRR